MAPVNRAMEAQQRPTRHKVRRRDDEAGKVSTFGVFLPRGSGEHRQNPVFAFLTARHSKPRWNFYKYLVGRDGRVLDYFVSFTKPGSRRLRKAIENALGQEVGKPALSPSMA
jgi:glutathione peroxidase-family protein